MKIHFTFVLFLVFWSRRPGVTGNINVYEVKEGDDVRVKFLFYTTGTWRYFCRNYCKKQEDILVKTSSNKEDNGRYSLEFKEKRSYPNEMFLSIRNVTLSDTGTYSCGLRIWHQNEWTYLYADFIIEVSSVVSSSPAPDLSSVTLRTSEPQEDHTPQSDVVLYVSLSLNVLFILSVTLASILFWRKRNNTTPEAPDIPLYAQVPQSTCVYEVIRAERAEEVL